MAIIQPEIEVRISINIFLNSLILQFSRSDFESVLEFRLGRRWQIITHQALLRE